MFKTFSRFMVSVSRPKTILVLLGLSVLLGSILAGIKAQMAAVPLPGGQFTYSAEQADLALAVAGSAGRRWFTAFQLVDLLFIPVYSLLYAATIRWTYPTLFANARLASVLSVVPLLGALIDCAENTCLLLLVAAYPHPIWTLATTAAVLTAAKWTLAGGSALLATAGLIGTAAGSAWRAASAHQVPTGRCRT